jgi:uncharacterized protein HemY
VDDRQDEVVRESIDESAPSDAFVGAETPPQSVHEEPVADATLETPLATLEMRVAPNGERQYTGRERWLRELNQGIVNHPEAPTNYVLRGELALATRDYEQAAADFEKALELASAQVETSDWGVLAQAMQDRAYRGLKEARRRLHR